MPLHVNHAFILDFAARNSGTILDYGCGAGDVVKAGLAAELDIYGCDIFYAGTRGDLERNSELIAQGRVRPIRDGVLPFASGAFNCVINNQVLEHVEDLHSALREIHRVLKPGGQMLSLFPSREVIREGHCGIPLAHRFAGSRFGYYWLLLFRMLGLGSHTRGATMAAWARERQQWLKTYCFYRTQDEIEAVFVRCGLPVVHREGDYIRFRGLPLFNPWMLRRFGFMVLLSTKAAS